MHTKHSRLRGAGGPRFAPDHRDLALCRQVQRTLSLSLAQCHDEVLQNLYVQQVVPAPDSTRLLVLVWFTTPGAAVPITDLLSRLDRVHGFLRSEVAQAITRKRAPELSFTLWSGGGE